VGAAADEAGCWAAAAVAIPALISAAATCRSAARRTHVMGISCRDSGNDSMKTKLQANTGVARLLVQARFERQRSA
jgi:hypothetical protein